MEFRSNLFQIAPSNYVDESLSYLYEEWPKMTWNDLNWSKMTQNELKWPRMTKMTLNDI